MKYLIIVLLVAIVNSAAGTAETIFDMPFNEACNLITSAILEKRDAMNYKELDGSLTVKCNTTNWREYDSWSSYVLPAYIWSTEAEVRCTQTVNIKPANGGTIVKTIVYWEMETPSGGWTTVESNNGQAEVMLNYLISVYEDEDE